MLVMAANANAPHLHAPNPVLDRDEPVKIVFRISEAGPKGNWFTVYRSYVSTPFWGDDESDYFIQADTLPLQEIKKIIRAYVEDKLMVMVYFGGIRNEWSAHFPDLLTDERLKPREF